MYFLLKMRIFQPAMLVFGGVRGFESVVVFLSNLNSNPIVKRRNVTMIINDPWNMKWFLEILIWGHEGSWTKSPRSKIRSIIPCFQFTNTATRATENHKMTSSSGSVTSKWHHGWHKSDVLHLCFCVTEPNLHFVGQGCRCNFFLQLKSHSTRTKKNSSHYFQSLWKYIPAENTKRTKIYLLPPQQNILTRDQHKKHLQQQKRRISQNIWNTPKDLKANPGGSTEER